ncbi:H-NS histone family protein [Photobacterium sp. ZSDE20]|uniref:DNA-binding protein n=1 Tax=Photobacterium pectinilyticum TaxID=2906793 RepID=A0ABT1N8J6_9GAMM|nr:H-NS family nucleoid-associated regulatory protein [Photobacterium sp. ZSDE20]MCQ1061085.1 H-NS histone family protein [Photobacterium sp. ZSDE20]MDD1826196.1 H-NS histone family protein [Photobacterium sp. ZSDE20]
MSEELFPLLLNLRSLRSQAREMELSQLQDGLEKLSQVVAEREEHDAKIQAEQSEKNSLLNKYRELLAADGILPEELLAITKGNKPSKRAPRPAKYEFNDGAFVRTWTGQGRTPSALKALLDQGASLEDFEIK